MGLLDKFKKKKEEPKPKAEEPRAEKAQVKEHRVQDTGMAYQILVRPVLSEKGTNLASQGRYVFEVHPGANKTEIRKSIEKVYDVHVDQVKIIKLPGKKRKYGRSIGRTSDWKKAVVVLRQGEKIPGIVESVG